MFDSEGIETVARESIEKVTEDGLTLTFSQNDISAIAKSVAAAFMEYESQKK